MNRLKQVLRHLILSAIACLIAVNLAAFSQPAQSQQLSTVSTTPSTSTSISTSIPTSSSTSSSTSIPTAATVHEAESILLAQALENKPMSRYVVALTTEEVVPMASSSNAFGTAGAALIGDRLVVRGNFSNLSSPLRDYTTDPLDPPNLNITSAVHIHQGELTLNGPFQYALQVSPSESGLQGQFMGEYTLTNEQLQALTSGKLYMDIHTQQNRAGELRGIFKPY